MQVDPYDVLGVEPGAPLREAVAAYRRLVALYHPDRMADMPPEVVGEANRRLREATAAMRAVRAQQRPLVAAGRQRPRPPAAVPVAVQEAPAERAHVGPSDAATEAEARLYDVELMAADGHGLHLRWGGRHAAATLAALRHAHRPGEGPIRQVEWGTYEVRLDGGAARRLIDGVLPDDDEWLHDDAIVVTSGENEHRLPARGRDEAGHLVIDMRTAMSLLDDDTWYTVLADVY